MSSLTVGASSFPGQRREEGRRGCPRTCLYCLTHLGYSRRCGGHGMRAALWMFTINRNTYFVTPQKAETEKQSKPKPRQVRGDWCGWGWSASCWGQKLQNNLQQVGLPRGACSACIPAESCSSRAILGDMASNKMSSASCSPPSSFMPPVLDPSAFVAAQRCTVVRTVLIFLLKLNIIYRNLGLFLGFQT